jgi:ribosomal subunit interface protein
MKLPLQITSRNVSLSDAAEQAIREKAAKLDHFYDQIMGCRVLVEAPHRHQNHGNQYNVRLDITVPGSEIVIKREENEDLYVAIRDAFDAAQRKVKDFSSKQKAMKGAEGIPLVEPETAQVAEQ